MPHIIVEYSSNLLDTLEPSTLLPRLHATLAELGEFKLQEIKSRLCRLSDYHVGDGANDRSFVHVTLAILAGRSLEVRQIAGRRLAEVVAEFCPHSRSNQQCGISVEVREMQRETYTKV